MAPLSYHASDTVFRRVSKNDRRNLCEFRHVFGDRTAFWRCHCGEERAAIGELALKHAKEGRTSSKRLYIEAVAQSLQTRQLTYKWDMALHIMCFERVWVRLSRIENEKLFQSKILSARHS